MSEVERIDIALNVAEEVALMMPDGPPFVVAGAYRALADELRETWPEHSELAAAMAVLYAGQALLEIAMRMAQQGDDDA